MKRITVIQRRTTYYRSPRPKPQPQDNGGCGPLILLFILLFSIFACGCTPEPPKRAPGTAPPQQVEQDQTKHVTAPPLKVAIFSDISGSITSSGIPRLQASDLAPLIDKIGEQGGELAVGLIKSASKEHLVRYRPARIPRPPIQKQGESAESYRKRITRHQSHMAKLQTKPVDNGRQRQKFTTDLKSLLRTPLAGSSDVRGACEIANLIMTEADPDMEGAVRYVIFITDGMNTSQGSFPKSLNAEVILVTSEPSAHDLSRYDPIMVTNIPAAIRLILNQTL